MLFTVVCPPGPPKVLGTDDITVKQAVDYILAQPDGMQPHIFRSVAPWNLTGMQRTK
jgi:hypothetical protein